MASLLPSDDDSDGFDNVASVLKESPAFMEGYIGAAREAARLAVGDMSSPVAFNVYRVPGGRPQREYVEGMPLGTRGGWMVRHYFPLDGDGTSSTSRFVKARSTSKVSNFLIS